MTFNTYCIKAAKELGGRNLSGDLRRDAMVAYSSSVSFWSFANNCLRNYQIVISGKDGSVSYGESKQEKP